MQASNREIGVLTDALDAPVKAQEADATADHCDDGSAINAGHMSVDAEATDLEIGLLPDTLDAPVKAEEAKATADHCDDGSVIGNADAPADARYELVRDVDDGSFASRALWQVKSLLGNTAENVEGGGENLVRADEDLDAALQLDYEDDWCVATMGA